MLDINFQYNDRIRKIIYLDGKIQRSPGAHDIPKSITAQKITVREHAGQTSNSVGTNDHPCMDMISTSDPGQFTWP